MMTFEDGLIMTCLLPLFSALYMLFRASFKTLTLTIFPLLDLKVDKRQIHSQQSWVRYGEATFHQSVHFLELGGEQIYLRLRAKDGGGGLGE